MENTATMKTLIANVETHNQIVDAIESIVDRNSVRYVLEALAEVCSAKADHIRENWQDESLAKAWDAEAARVLKTAFQSRLA
jgi:hypothetical protein